MATRPVVAPRATDRLFFAVYPDAPARERLARLAQLLRERHGLRGRAFAPERFHVTLAMAGDHVGLPPEVLERAFAAGAAIRGAPFELTLDRVEAFARPKNRPCVLLAREGFVPLVALHEALERSLKASSLLSRAERAYRPHLTLQYDDRGLPAQAVEPIGWVVDEVVLMRSLLGRSQHLPLARWRLRG
jgi:RNA 2',3'-cyclic 3'-phosphodiesterase